jgi:hypothetical protein
MPQNEERMLGVAWSFSAFLYRRQGYTRSPTQALLRLPYQLVNFGGY